MALSPRSDASGMHGFAALALATFLLIGLPAVALSQEDVAESPSGKIAIDERPILETPISAEDREHWAFRPVVSPPAPAVQNTVWPRSGIDAYILAKLEEKGLAPAPEASRAALLRRLSFDLAGLPPSPADLAAFEADRSPDAFERLVDRLLADPAYGERMGQFWLDLARYADTDGFEHDKVRPSAWKYRDWLIAAFNADLPYDEFIRQQVAGDEISQTKEESENSIATTFCLAGPDMPDINDQVERRHNLLNELTATVGSVLLGLQMGCAQCHDHKYDPISQADFYRLRGVFESAVPALKRDGPYNTLMAQKDPLAPRFWIRGDHRRPGREVSPAVPRIAVFTSTAALNEPGSARTAFADWLFEDENPLTARVMANRLWQQHFGRGIFDTPSDVGLINAGPTHPELLDWLATRLREGGWSIKDLKREIVSSATYRQASMSDLATAKSLDPDNHQYWRYPRRRLEGEVLRDAMLSSAGLLNFHRGGPGVMPPLPPELVGTLLKGQWTESPDEADHYRRSIYVFARRNLRYPIFEAFDRPDANASCAVRNRSTTAPQSLVLLNSEFSLLAARHVAGRVLEESRDWKDTEPDGKAKAQIATLYHIVLSRQPSQHERTLLSDFLIAQRERLSAEGRPADELALPEPLLGSEMPAADRYAAAALVDACLALLNSSEFLYVD
jgi:hypothetical protein